MYVAKVDSLACVATRLESFVPILPEMLAMLAFCDAIVPDMVFVLSITACNPSIASAILGNVTEYAPLKLTLPVAMRFLVNKSPILADGSGELKSSAVGKYTGLPMFLSYA